MYTGPREEGQDDRDLMRLREEHSREERVQRRNRASWTIVLWVMAASLALLAYDSGGAAIDAHRSGRPWLYPAGVSVVCLLVLLVLLMLTIRAVRRRRDGVS